jgi:hypothetical protein
LLAMKKAKKNAQGQALIEVLPAILLFFVVIGASIIFFIGLRESFYMQMAARNSLFAKIRNSGPLVTTSNSLGYAQHYDFAFTGVNPSPLVTQNSTCFTAIPDNSAPAVLPTILGLSLNLERAHRATIFRKPGPPNSCDGL